MSTQFRRPVRVLRAGSGTWVDGVFVPGVPTTEFVLATIQPVSLADLDKMQPLPEGRRVDQMIRVYTDIPLAVAGMAGSQGDQIVWPEPGVIPSVESRAYRVIARADWQGGVFPHHKHIAAVET